MDRTFKKIHRYLTKFWRAFACASGVAVIAGVLGWLIVWSLAGDGRVIALVDPLGELSNPRDVTKTAKVGGFLAYTWDFERREACPGITIATFTSINTGVPAIVTFSRPVGTSLKPQVYRNFTSNIQMPPSVTRGRWRYCTATESTCSLRTQLDPILCFELEVTE